MEIDRAARRRGLFVLLADQFLMWAGFFMVIPLISVHYVDGLGWAAGTIGAILAVRQLVQQGFTVVSGALADRLGAKGLICIGMIVRGVGFGAMAWADSVGYLLAAATLAALGGALFEAPRLAAVAVLTDERNRARYYSLSGVVGGLGLTIGPFLGALLLHAGFDVVAIGSASCYFVTFLITFALLPAVRTSTGGATAMAGVRLALRDRPFVKFNLLLMGYWFMSSQLSISFPLVATAIAGTSSAVSWVFGLNAGMIVVLQYPVMRLAEPRLRPQMALIAGMVVMATGLVAIGFAAHVPVLLAAVAVYSFGQLLASPSQQTVTASFANPVAVGSYFGVAALSLAFGGSLGNLSGGFLYELGEHLDTPALPWLIFAAIGSVAAVGLVMLDRRLAMRREENLVSVAPAGR